MNATPEQNENVFFFYVLKRIKNKMWHIGKKYVYNLKQRGCKPFPCERPLIHLALVEDSQSQQSY